MALTIPKSLAGTPASIKSQAEALLAKATTLAEVNSILALARSSNVTPDSALVAKTKTAIADAGKQTTAAAKAAADKAAADKAAADKAAAAAAAAKAATAPGTVPYAAKALGMTEAEFTAAAQKLIATNPTYKNRDVAYVANTIGAKTGDLSSQVKTQAKAIADQAIADKAAQAQGYANAQAKKEADNTMANITAGLKNPQSFEQLSDLQKQAAAVGKTIDPALIKSASSTILSNANSADNLANRLNEAQRLGFSVDADIVKTVTDTVTKDIKTLDQVKAFNSDPKFAALGIKVPEAQTQQIVKDAVAGVKSFDELKALDARVQGIGQKLDQNLVDSAVDTISRASGATTRESLAALQKSAEAAGYKPSQSYVDQQTAVLDKADADAKAAEQKAYAEQQTKINNIIAGLPQPGSREFNDRALESGAMNYPVKSGGLTFIARIGNQAKNEPAGWYISSDGGKTYRTVGSAADSPTIPAKDLANSYNVDKISNALINKGVPAEEVNARIDDVVKNYGGTSNFNQALDSAAVSPESYARFKQTAIPPAMLEQTKAINDKLSAGGYYNQVWTRDELNSIVQQAKEQGLPINEALVSAVDSAIAAREKTLNTTLPAIPENDLNEIGGAGAAPQRVYENGREYIAMPADPVTGKPAGYYTYFYDQNDVLHYATQEDYNSFLKTGVVPKTAMDQAQFQQLSNTTAANVKQVETGNEMTEWYKTTTDPKAVNNYLAEAKYDPYGGFKTAPDGTIWKLVPGDDKTGKAPQWYTAEPNTGVWNPAELTSSGAKVDTSTSIKTDDLNKQWKQQYQANWDYVAEQKAAARAAQEAEWNKGGGFGDLFDSDLFKLAAVAAIAWVAAPYVSSWLASTGTAAAEGAAALTEGASAAAGLAEAGMGTAEIAATLEASGVSTAAADLMAEQAVALATGGSSAVSAAATASGVTAEMLAAANAVAADPMAALIAQAGWTTVDMAYLASIGAPAAILAAGEATNVALGLPASEIGTAATAEVAGTVPPGTAAEVAASQPVAPVGAETVATAPVTPPVDTSQMIPTVDAAGNPGFFDPATGNTLNSAGQVVAEGAMPAIGEGTQLAAAYTPAQEAQYAELISQGYSPAQAVEAIGAAGEAAAIPEILITGSTAPAITAEEAILGAAGLGGLGAIAAGGGGAAAPAATTPPAAPSPAAPSAPTPAQPVQPTEVPVTEATPTPVEPTTPVQPAQPTAPVETPVATQPTAPVEPGPYAPPTTTAPTELATPATSGQPAIPGTETQAPVYDAGPTSLPSTEVVPPPPVTPQYPVDVPTTPVDPGNPYAPDNIDVGGGWNPAEVPVTDAVAVPAPGTGLPGTIPTGGLGLKDLANLYAGSQLLGALLVPQIPEIKRRTYAPIGDVTFGDVGRVNLPGTNPGQFVGVPAQYQTNNMQQSKFYWGQHPYQTGATFSPEQYKQVAAPVTPWGLQQMYNPQTQTINSLLQGVQQASTQAPYNVPRAPLV